MSDKSQPEDIYKRRSTAIQKLDMAIETMFQAMGDSYAPVNIRSLIEVVELRLTELKKLYS